MQDPDPAENGPDPQPCVSVYNKVRYGTYHSHLNASSLVPGKAMAEGEGSNTAKQINNLTKFIPIYLNIYRKPKNNIFGIRRFENNKLDYSLILERVHFKKKLLVH